MCVKTALDTGQGAQDGARAAVHRASFALTTRRRDAQSNRMGVGHRQVEVRGARGAPFARVRGPDTGRTAGGGKESGGAILLDSSKRLFHTSMYDTRLTYSLRELELKVSI